MVPVDLAHKGDLDKALKTAADLASHYGVPVCYVGVTSPQPGSVAHTPEEFAKKLEGFAQDEAKKHGHEASSKSYTSHDPTVDIDDTLLKAVKETDSDLVVMASHAPNILDYVWPSNGGKVAEHAKASVFVVR
jgi:nucleotide-binding universal stress UspA family protein